MRNSVVPIFLLIAVFNTVARAETVIYAQVGQTVTLKAQHIVNQNVYGKWYFEGEEIAWINSLGGKGFSPLGDWKNQLSLSESSLIIKNIQDGLFGTFEFSVIGNKQPSPPSRFRLIKFTVEISRKMPVLPGDHLSLTCDVETPQGEEKPKIYWKRHNEKLKKSNTGSFNFQVTTQHTGVWTCVMEKGGKELLKINVSVEVVDFSSSPACQYTSTNSRLSIPFLIPASLPLERMKQDIKEVQLHFTPKTSPSLNSQTLFVISPGDRFNWMKKVDRQLDKAPDTKTGNFSLFRYRGREDDSGNYTCTITFSNGATLSRTVQVQVLKIIPSPGTELQCGQKLNLLCTTGDALPSDLELKWIPPEKKRYTPGPIPNLTIASVGMEHNGKWMCELWQKGSKSRLVSAVMTLKVESLLSVWMLVTICSTAAIVILLLVVTFILYRRRQRRTRHLRHRLCQCKNPKPKGFYRS